MSYRLVGVLALGVLAAVAGCDTTAPRADDAGSDGGAPDAGTFDAGRPCETDVDCDDGLFCNGVEQCAAGVCAAGIAPRCDDGIACTRDFCSEERASCVSQVPDADGDGFGDASCTDAEGEPLGTDCDDGDANRFPGNLEVCDDAGHDEDCDPSTRGGLDADGDGFESAECCNPLPGGGTSCGDDCDDGRRQVNPSGTEVCDGIDDDCDGRVDEGVQVMTYADADRDGEGDPATAMMACAGVAGRVSNGTDCDDTRVDRRMGQPEICDGVDNDCDDRIDEMAGPVPWYRDADGDGFGTPMEVVESCTPVSGSSLLGTDCDDTRAAINPAAAELCDGIDNDCSGRPDFQIAPGDYEDDDGDGYVDIACGAPLGVDCRDNDPSAGPGEAETCDGRDQDCDGRIDEGVVSYAWFRDADGDGYGSNGGGLVVSCGAITGHVRRGGDCDDADPARNPAASETCSGRDEDCDGAVDEAPASDMCVDALGQDLACVAGSCRRVACLGGRADCDGRPDTGCEVTLASDPAHCGGCGIRCGGAPGTVSSCVASACEPAVCASGRIDCDGDLGVPGGNGCEIVGATCPPIVRSFSWGGTEHDDPDDGAMEIALLSDGRSYVAASYWGSIRVGETNHSAPGSGTLLLHFDPLQRLVWARNVRVAGEGGVTLTRLLVDDATGDVFVTGSGSGDNALFDGSPIGPVGSGAGIVMRVSATGSLLWGVTFPGDWSADVRGLARDGAGDVVVAGTIQGSAFIGETQLVAEGQADGFVARLAPSDGEVLGVFQLGNAEGSERAHAIAVLPGGDYVVVGEYDGLSADFGGVGLTTGGNTDGFWARLTPAGAGIHAGGADGPQADSFFDVQVGPSGDYYVSGRFDGTTVVGGISLAGGPMPGGMLARVSASSGAATWAHGQEGSGSADHGMRRFVVDASEVIRAVLPSHTGTGATFGGVALAPTSTSGTFVVVVSGAGTITQIVPLVSPVEGFSMLSIARAGGRTLGAGVFSGSATFGGHPLVSNGGSDQVVVRFGDL